MSDVIATVDAIDVRFPTSRDMDGSDAMNPEPDYSAAYVTLRTTDGEEGYGLAFTVDRGNDVQVAAIRALAPLAVGLPVADVLGDLRAFSERLTGDSQMRWLGPHKGAIHMAAGAIVNAVAPIRVATGEHCHNQVMFKHFVDPVVIRDGRYVAPAAPGIGARMHPESVAAHRFPDGPQWRPGR